MLVVINSNQLSGAPSASDSGQETFDYLARHHGRFQIGAVLWGFAMAGALLWLSGLFRALRRAEGGTPGLALVALGGGVLAAATTLTGALIEGTMAARVSDLGPSVVTSFWTLYLLSFGATLFGLLVLIGTTAVISLQARLFAHWFRVASAVLALASIAGAFTIGYNGDAIQAVAGIAILLDAGWILAVSIFLWRDPSLALP